MRVRHKLVELTIYQSNFVPEVETTDKDLAEAIRWADDNTVAWKVIRESRSKVWGRGSSTYMGWAQKNDSPSAVLERLRCCHAYIMHEGLGPEIFYWRARFTLEHYDDQGFTGGFFQQWDVNGHPRAGLFLDYTPSTVQEVLKQFEGWMDRSFQTGRITIDGDYIVKDYQTD